MNHVQITQERIKKVRGFVAVWQSKSAQERDNENEKLFCKRRIEECNKEIERLNSRLLLSERV